MYCLTECYDDRTAYYNHDIPGWSGKQNKRKTPKKCQRSCQNHAKCEFWTFDKKNKLCYLKTCRGDVRNGLKESKFISGDKDCDPPKTTLRPPLPTTPRCIDERRPRNAGRGKLTFTLTLDQLLEIFVSGQCYDDGTAYYMNNIPGKFSRHNPEQDAKRCQRQCQREPRCKFWTFDRAHEWCYLKTCRQNVKNTMAENHYISGDKNCQPPTRLSSWTHK